jgi:hypothetical protein
MRSVLTVAGIMMFAESVSAQSIHPYQDQLNLLTTPEKNILNAFTNSYPSLGVPALGQSGKEVKVITEKYSLFNPGATKPSGSLTCVVTLTTTRTVIKVDYPDYYTHSKQTVKMSPSECALDDEDGSVKADGVFALGKTSRVTKTSVIPDNALYSILDNYSTWTIAGKAVKYTWSEEPEDGVTIVSDGGTLNFGAANLLCADSSTNYNERGEFEYEEDPTKTVKYDYKEIITSSCLPNRPVLGKVNTDVMSLVVDEDTEYCEEDLTEDLLDCRLLEEFDVDTFPEQLIPVLPDLVDPEV